MTHLLDVNVLLALAWPNHIHHRAAREWFAHSSASGWATCPLTESGFIRVSSNRRATPDARSPREAALLLSRICALPRHAFVSDGVSLATMGELLGQVAHGSAHVTDTHLVVLARDHGLSFLTFDRGAADIAAALNVPHTLLTI